MIYYYFTIKLQKEYCLLLPDSIIPKNTVKYVQHKKLINGTKHKLHEIHDTQYNTKIHDTENITKYTTQYTYLKYKIVYECMQYYTVQYGNIFTIQKYKSTQQIYTTRKYNVTKIHKQI